MFTYLVHILHCGGGHYKARKKICVDVLNKNKTHVRKFHNNYVLYQFDYRYNQHHTKTDVTLVCFTNIISDSYYIFVKIINTSTNSNNENVMIIIID